MKYAGSNSLQALTKKIKDYLTGNYASNNQILSILSSLNKKGDFLSNSPEYQIADLDETKFKVPGIYHVSSIKNDPFGTQYNTIGGDGSVLNNVLIVLNYNSVITIQFLVRFNLDNTTPSLSNSCSIAYRVIYGTGATSNWIKICTNLTYDIARHSPDSNTDAVTFYKGDATKVIPAVPFYPVGSIYLSVNSTNPKTYFEYGTWELITEGTFLVSASTTSSSKYYGGKTGGEAEHTLTEDEMPTHRHKQYVTANPGTGVNPRADYNEDTGNYSAYEQCVTGNAGGGQAHNNIPPYLAVYMWKRTA